MCRTAYATLPPARNCVGPRRCAPRNRAVGPPRPPGPTYLSVWHFSKAASFENASDNISFKAHDAAAPTGGPGAAPSIRATSLLLLLSLLLTIVIAIVNVTLHCYCE